MKLNQSASLVEKRFGRRAPKRPAGKAPSKSGDPPPDLQLPPGKQELPN